MDDVERKERSDGRTSAIEEFGNWYKKIYFMDKEKILKIQVYVIHFFVLILYLIFTIFFADAILHVENRVSLYEK